MHRGLEKKLQSASLRVIKSGWYVLGHEAEQFEKEFASFLDVPYCVGVASGTDAITLALLANGILPGDEVITTDVSAFPTITAIIRAGAVPVPADILSENGLINIAEAEKKISRKTKAIVPVHLYGQSCAIDEIKKLCVRRNLKLIEDCAQSSGTLWHGKHTGTFGHAGAFSFYPTKNLGCIGDGGAICTKEKKIYEKLLLLRNYGQRIRYYHDEPGFNSRLDEIQAAFLRVKLPYLGKWITQRRALADIYIKNLPAHCLLKEPNGGKNSYHLFVIKSRNRDKLAEHLRNNGIQSLIHYPVPLHRQKAFCGKASGSFYQAEQFTDTIVSLPLYPGLSESSVKKICRVTAEFENKIFRT